MKRLFRSLLLLLTVVPGLGCGGEARPGTRPDGTPADRRLQEVFIESEAGASVFTTFYDRTLDIECAFEKTASDELRCLPSGDAVSAITEIVFADAKCEQPLALLLAPERSDLGRCRSTPPYAVLQSCDATPAVYRVGNASHSSSLYRLVDGTCVQDQAGAPAWTTGMYEIEQISVGEFVRGTLHTGRGDAGVLPIFLRSDDGIERMAGFRDTKDAFDCSLSGDGSPLRCMPVMPGLVGYLFADATCSTPAAMAFGCDANGETLGFAQGITPQGRVIYYGGKRLASGFSGTSESCQADTSAAAFSVGTQIPLERFAIGVRRTDRYADGLTTTADVVGSLSLPKAPLESTAFGGHACHVAPAADGQLRCLPPPESRIDGFFADQDCTQRVEYTQASVLAIEDRSTSPAHVRVFERAAEHTGPVFAMTNGSCAPAHPKPPNHSARTPYHVFPVEIAPERFVKLTRPVR